MATQNKETSITFRIDEADKIKLAEIAKAQERNLSQLIRLIIQNYLKDK